MAHKKKKKEDRKKLSVCVYYNCGGFGGSWEPREKWGTKIAWKQKEKKNQGEYAAVLLLSIYHGEEGVIFGIF